MFRIMYDANEIANNTVGIVYATPGYFMDAKSNENTYAHIIISNGASNAAILVTKAVYLVKHLETITIKMTTTPVIKIGKNTILLDNPS